MGYILPIAFDVYHQYSLRDIREETNPFRTNQIERAAKASLFQLGAIPVQKASLELKKKVGQESEVIDQTYAELTGIGRRFDRKI